MAVLGGDVDRDFVTALSVLTADVLGAYNASDAAVWVFLRGQGGLATSFGSGLIMLRTSQIR